jgi:hypothetical protein
MPLRHPYLCFACIAAENGDFKNQVYVHISLCLRLVNGIRQKEGAKA